jgi:hypothetical protein
VQRVEQSCASPPRPGGTTHDSNDPKPTAVSPKTVPRNAVAPTARMPVATLPSNPPQATSLPVSVNSPSAGTAHIGQKFE